MQKRRKKINKKGSGLWQQFLLAIIIAFNVMNVSGQSQTFTSREFVYDTSRTAILEIQTELYWIFDSTWRPTILTPGELKSIDSLVIIAVKRFNWNQQRRNASHPWEIDLIKYKYRKQIMAVTNQSGERRVWVNCFCSGDHDDWKTSVVQVADGGTCYFNFKINLQDRSVYAFMVNSEG